MRRYSQCSICGIEIYLSGNGRNAPEDRRRCMQCIQEANYKDCKNCGDRFYRARKRGAFCSSDCWYEFKRVSKERKRESVNTRSSTRRARKKEAFVEYVDHTRVFARDQWTCWICEGLVIPNHPRWAPSIDHVVPLSQGGLHCYANVRTAHMLCNHVKGARYWPPVPLDPILRPINPHEEYTAS